MSLNDIYESLAILYESLPNSVTAYHNKLILIGLSLELLNVRLACNHLLVIAQFVILFVLEISKRTGEVQTTIDSAHVDYSSCILDAFFFFFTFRLMVKGKINSFSLSAKDTSGISCVGHIEMSGSHEYNISCASSVFGDRVRDMNISNTVELNGSFLAGNYFVHFSKGLTQSL